MTAASILAAFVALPILAAPPTVLELGARTELRYRHPGSVRSDNALASESWDWELDANARLGTRQGSWQFWLGYAPRLVLADFTGETTSDLLHVGDASAEWTANRRLRLGVFERAAYGFRSFTSLSVPTTDPMTRVVLVQAAPRTTSARYVASDTEARSTMLLSPRTQLLLSVGYGIGGGVDAESRAVVPYTVGPRATAELTLSSGRRDAFITYADAAYYRTYGVPGASVVRVAIIHGGERWRRTWSRFTSSELNAGVVIVPELGSTDATHVYPRAGVAGTHVLRTGPGRGHLDVTVAASTDAQFDQLSGTADQRFQATLQATWVLDRLAFYALVGRAQSLHPSHANALELTFMEAGSRYQLSRTFELNGGVRIVDQNINAPLIVGANGAQQNAVEGLYWTGFVGLAYRGLPIPL